MPELDVVTGAFGYTGKYITRKLFGMGRNVRTLTGHPARDSEFGTRLETAPMDFEDAGKLIENLRGATTLYNTYWVRFPHGATTFEKAVANTRKLLDAAAEAGVRKIVHVSITNPSVDSPLPYFRGKGELEKAIAACGIPYAVIRPTVIFGLEDILINNIAWLLRKFPVFAVPGKGGYRLQPVFVEDVAEMAVAAAQQAQNRTFDAVGPEVYTFEEMVRLIARHVHSRARIVHLKPSLALFLAGALGHVVEDVILTREELDGLIAGLLVSTGPPTGETCFSRWLEKNAASLGTSYSSELARHYR
jgi:NADH dehydrogenase